VAEINQKTDRVKNVLGTANASLCVELGKGGLGLGLKKKRDSSPIRGKRKWGGDETHPSPKTSSPTHVIKTAVGKKGGKKHPATTLERWGERESKGDTNV